MHLIRLLMLCLLLVPACALGQTGMTLITATDLHYLAPELTDGGPYFTKLISRADGKVMAVSEELTQAFADQVISRRPDALILSGDLTFNGERASHIALAKKLCSIANAGIAVYVLPGNHDLRSRGAARFSGDGYERVESVTAEEFADIYRDFGFDGALARDPASLSYTAALGDGLRLLMVDVNTAAAPGRLPEETAAWIAGQLADAQKAGCRVIAVSHQNLLDHSSMFSKGFTMDGAQALRALYARADVLVNLSGHIHMQHIRQEDGLCDIATSSLAVSPNQYGVLTLTPQTLDYRTEPVDVRAWALAHGLDDPRLTDFAAYSDGFFKDNARRQAMNAILDDDNPGELAEAFAQLNAAFFAGRPDLYRLDRQLLRRWQRQPASLSAYIESIACEEPRSHCALTVPLR